MIELLPPSALSCGDAGNPGVHHAEIAAHQTCSYRAEQVMEKFERFIQCMCCSKSVFELRCKNNEGGNGIMCKLFKAIIFETLGTLVGTNRSASQN